MWHFLWVTFVNKEDELTYPEDVGFLSFRAEALLTAHDVHLI
jgi:hypothetical protein